MESGKALVVFFIVLLLAASVGNAKSPDSQKEYHLKLLAVSEEGKFGLTADMYVRVAPGTGSVFIEAEPVTKLDTRISTNLAKEIACDSLSLSAMCGSRDFFFRIDANASLIGGPSAGAAAAALAISAVEGLEINQSVAVTGTINSGGLVGEVGGLKEKIDAASANGISRVLIPVGERYFRAANRSSALDLVSYGESVGVDVVEVSDIRDVLFYVTGRSYPVSDESLAIDKSYSAKMDELASGLCTRSKTLSAGITAADALAIGDGNMSDGTSVQEVANAAEVLEAAGNLTRDGLEEKTIGNHYSAASFCFGANVRYSYLSLLKGNRSAEEALQQGVAVSEEIDSFESGIPEAKSLAALQVRGTVKDRLQEARKLLELSSEDLKGNRYNDGIYRLAFAKERLGSAEAWNSFIKGQRQTYAIGSGDLRSGCTARLEEAEEHIQYLEIYLPGLLTGKELGPVYSQLREMDYSSCIFSASLVKAKANAMLSALGGSANITSLIDRKLEAAKASIIRQTGKGEFPIVSYSYYEYANSLKDTDQASALLFSEYSLELSNLDVYIDGAESKSQGIANSGQQFSPLLAAASGFAAGLLTVFAALAVKQRFRKKKPVIVVKKRHQRKA